MTLTVNTNGPALVDHARVIEVQFREYTVTVVTTFTNREFTVPFATPYTHGNHGGGINFMPEVGSHCYLCIPSDETAFILGFVQNPRNIPKEIRDENNELISEVTDSGPDFSGQRHPLEPGDISLSATGDNFVTLRRGGILQIGSTALAQRIYIPIENTVRDFFQRYQAFSPIGEIEWGHAALTSDDDMSSTRNTPVFVKYNIKAKAQEDTTEGKFTVEVRAGTLNDETLDLDLDNEHIFANENLRGQEWGGDNNTLIDNSVGAISITVYSHEESHKKVTYAFQVATDGNLFMKSEASIHLEVSDKLYVKADGGVTIEFGGDSDQSVIPAHLKLLQNKDFEAMVEKATVKAVQAMVLEGSIITLAAPSIQLAGNVTIGATPGRRPMWLPPEDPNEPQQPPDPDAQGMYPVIINNGLLESLLRHTHPINASGTTTPSIELGDILSNEAKIYAKLKES